MADIEKIEDSYDNIKVGEQRGNRNLWNAGKLLGPYYAPTETK